MAVLAALASSLLWGVADFAGGLASRRLPSVVVVGWSQISALVVLTPLVLVTIGVPAPGAWLGWGLAAGVAGLAGLVTFYRALAIGTMGVVSPIAALGAIVPVLVAVAEGERPGPVEIAGMVLALAGAVLASGPELRGEAGSRRRAVALAVLAGLFFGLTLAFMARGSTAGPLPTIAAMRISSLVVFGGAALFAHSLGGVRPRQVPGLLGIGLADAGANFLFALASTLGLVSVVSVLGSIYPVVTVLLARVLLAERLQPVQAAGVALAMGGIALLSLG